MIIRLDPITGLWCRSDGAVLMPPSHRGGMHYRWTFGSNDKYGYKQLTFHGKLHRVHRIICRAFHGLPPADKPEVDHIDRCRSNNRCDNLRWASRKENEDNTDRVDRALEKYNCRACDDKAAYSRARRKSHPEKHRAYSRTYYESHREERKAYYETHREENKAYRSTHHKEYNARSKACYAAHREEYAARGRARWASKAAEMKAQGLAWGKGPDGKYGWHPRKCTETR